MISLIGAQFYLGFFVISIVAIAFFVFIFFKKDSFLQNEQNSEDNSTLISDLMRNFWYWLFDPILKFLLFIKLSPNYISLISLFLSAVAGIFFAVGEIVWGAWILLLSGTFDALDGRLARYLGKSTKIGNFLDSCLDRFSDCFIFLGILYYYRFDFIFFIIMSVIIASATGISYFKAKAESLGVKNNVGLMKRPERFWVVCMSGIFAPYISATMIIIGVKSVSIEFVFKIAMVFLAITTFFTAMVRLFNGIKALKIQEKE